MLLMVLSLENDSPSRGRKLKPIIYNDDIEDSLENDSPSRGRKLYGVPGFYPSIPFRK